MSSSNEPDCVVISADAFNLENESEMPASVSILRLFDLRMMSLEKTKIKLFSQVLCLSAQSLPTFMWFVSELRRGQCYRGAVLSFHHSKCRRF